MKDREELEQKFRNDKKELEKELQEFYDEINSLDLDIHINQYEEMGKKINSLDEKIEPFNVKIENNLIDEEKIFSFKNFTFDDHEKMLKKLHKYSILWTKANNYYDIKKHLILSFSEDLEFLKIVNQFNDIEKIVAANRISSKKEEETIVKVSKIIEDDLDTTREFILLVYNIFSVEALDDGLRIKIIEMLESKKLEQSCKLIIGNVLQERNYRLV